MDVRVKLTPIVFGGGQLPAGNRTDRIDSQNVVVQEVCKYLRFLKIIVVGKLCFNRRMSNHSSLKLGKKKVPGHSRSYNVYHDQYHGSLDHTMCTTISTTALSIIQCVPRSVPRLSRSYNVHHDQYHGSLDHIMCAMTAICAKYISSCETLISTFYQAFISFVRKNL